jgi:hypothetical protein
MTFFISMAEYPCDDTCAVISSMCMPQSEVAIKGERRKQNGRSGGGRGEKYEVRVREKKKTIKY